MVAVRPVVIIWVRLGVVCVVPTAVVCRTPSFGVGAGTFPDVVPVMVVLRPRSEEGAPADTDLGEQFLKHI